MVVFEHLSSQQVLEVECCSARSEMLVVLMMVWQDDLEVGQDLVVEISSFDIWIVQVKLEILEATSLLHLC